LTSAIGCDCWLTGAWGVYQHGSTAGSISLLIRSGSNIGISQQFNLSDKIGSGLYLNCLQGGGPQEPITVNILYWRQERLLEDLPRVPSAASRSSKP
jgi:porin